MTESFRVDVREIRLQNFRSFKNTRLILSDLTFLVGRNGAGKTSVLDAFDFLRESVSDSLENALDRRGGLQQVRRMQAGPGRRLTMGLAILLEIQFSGERRHHVIYGFELIGDSGSGAAHLRESLKSIRRSSFSRRDDEFESVNTPNATPPRGNLILPLVARSDRLWEIVLDAIRNLRVYELSPAIMASAQEIGDRSTLERNGVNAGDVLKAIEGSSSHDWIIERIARIADGFTDIRSESLLGKRVLRFFQKQVGGEFPFYANQVSQGTLRSLGILLALQQIPTPTVVLIDEIENSIHPGGLSVLLEAALSGCEKGARVVLTSHSPEVLNHPSVTGERVRVVEWNNGTSHIYRLNSRTISAVDEVDTVGWMLRSNALWKNSHPDSIPGDLLDFISITNHA